MEKVSKIIHEVYKIGKSCPLEELMEVLRPYWGKTLICFSVDSNGLKLERVEGGDV